MESELLQQRRRHPHQVRRRRRSTAAAAACAASRSTAARSSTRAVVSNANLKATIFHLVGEEHFDRDVRRRGPGRAAEQFQHPGLHGPQAGRAIDESTGDLLFSSTAPLFRTELLLSRDITSRTYSFYYPRTRPEGRPRCLIVSSTNANYDDWAELAEEDYEASKRDLVETTLDALDKYVPDIREQLDHVEASTPRDVPALHASTSTGRASARSSKAWPSAGRCRSRSPGCTTPAAWASSCRAGWGR